MASDTVVVGRAGSDRLALLTIDRDAPSVEVPVERLADAIADREARGEVRWVWADTASIYPGVLKAGARVARAWDLRLVHGILRDAEGVVDDHGLRSHREWDAGSAAPATGDTLFDLGDASTGLPDSLDAAVAEYRRQLAAIASSSTPGALRLLCAAESAGALVAAELHAAGVPWSRTAHEEMLERQLGTRRGGGLPAASSRPPPPSARRSTIRRRRSTRSRGCCGRCTARVCR